MYNITIVPEVRKYIRKYIDAYEIYYENLYQDSGLGIAEDIIIAQYTQSARAISDTIYTAIEQAIKPEIIFGYSTKNDIRVITTRIENRRLFISYTESHEMQERTVVEMEIVYL